MPAAYAGILPDASTLSAHAPAPALGTAARPEPPRSIIHKLVDGDTLEGLAAKYLGDAALAGLILETNLDKIARADLLPIGVDLQIPARPDRDPRPGPRKPAAPRPRQLGRDRREPPPVRTD